MGPVEPTATPARRPESVLVLVYTPDADVLLLKRRRPFEFWQSVTGALEPLETHRDAALRELREETGFDDSSHLVYAGIERVFEIDARWRHRYAPGVTHNTEYEWRYASAGPVAVRIDDDEHAAYCWLPIDRAIESVWSWTNRDALAALRDTL